MRVCFGRVAGSKRYAKEYGFYRKAIFWGFVMEKKDIKKILILSGVLLLVIVLRLLFGNSYNYDDLVTSYDEGYKVINDAIMKGKGEIHFESTVYPNFADFDRILGDTVCEGSYAGCEVYSIKYSYEPKGGAYDVNVEVENPNRLSSLLMEWRAGRIASHFEDLPTDYDKVKAAHDYLVLLNRYTYIEGGAFSALYKERSSCTGYAYAFYAIMNKLNIPVTIEVGGYHAWNRVMLDGKWYNIDVTWDDPDNQEISYSYFLKCDADWRGHHHGGATAETSIEPFGTAALTNYKMVPPYNRFREIFIVLLCIAPVGFLAYKVSRRGKKEKDITDNALMVLGDWNYMPPARKENRFEFFIKKNIKSRQTDIWYEENGRYFVEKSFETSVLSLEEISEERFTMEVNYIINSVEASRNAVFKDAMINAAAQLNIPIYAKSYGRQEAPADANAPLQKELPPIGGMNSLPGYSGNENAPLQKELPPLGGMNSFTGASGNENAPLQKELPPLGSMNSLPGYSGNEKAPLQKELPPIGGMNGQESENL